MARIAGIDLPKNKRGEIGLTYIYGIGNSSSKKILEKAGVDLNKKVQDWDDDDLSKMADAIAMGRKIYTNLKKAIQYIISIHIPIILTVFIPLALGWIYPSIFTPLHIILLELIMGPTCSIIFENEPGFEIAAALTSNAKIIPC